MRLDVGDEPTEVEEVGLGNRLQCGSYIIPNSCDTNRAGPEQLRRAGTLRRNCAKMSHQIGSTCAGCSWYRRRSRERWGTFEALWAVIYLISADSSIQTELTA